MTISDNENMAFQDLSLSHGMKKQNYNTNKINPIQIQNNKNGTCTNVQRN